MRSALFAAVFALLAIPARAQTNDARWEPWLGCWTLAVDNLRDRQAPDGQPQRATRPSTVVEGAPRVCVTRTPGGARFETTVGGQAAIDQTIVADAVGHPLTDDECSGTQRTEWSKNGLRLFSSAEIRCKSDEGPRRVSGFSLIAPNGDWVDIQTVSIGGRESVRVKRYYRAADSPRSNRPTVASSRLTLDEVMEASAKVSSPALEAALVESNAGFDLTARKVTELDSAGVSDRVIDLMVALSYPDKFVVQRVAQGSPGGSRLTRGTPSCSATAVRSITTASTTVTTTGRRTFTNHSATVGMRRCVRPDFLRRLTGLQFGRVGRVGLRRGTCRQWPGVYACGAARLPHGYAVEHSQDVVDDIQFDPVRRLWLIVLWILLVVLGLLIRLIISRVRRWKQLAGWFNERQRLERLRSDSGSALALRLAGARSGQAESSLQLHDQGTGSRVNRGPAHHLQHLLEAPGAQRHSKIDNHHIPIDLNPFGQGVEVSGDRAGDQRQRTRSRYRPSQPQRRVTRQIRLSIDPHDDGHGGNQARPWFDTNEGLIAVAHRHDHRRDVCVALEPFRDQPIDERFADRDLARERCARDVSRIDSPSSEQCIQHLHGRPRSSSRLKPDCPRSVRL